MVSRADPLIERSVAVPGYVTRASYDDTCCEIWVCAVCKSLSLGSGPTLHDSDCSVKKRIGSGHEDPTIIYVLGPGHNNPSLFKPGDIARITALAKAKLSGSCKK